MNTPYWLGALAGGFRHPHRESALRLHGADLFNPAADALSQSTVCRPDLVFTYADPAAGWLPLSGDCAAVTAVSPGASLHAGLKPSILPLDLLWGMYPGPMGCTAALVLGAAALFLLARRCIGRNRSCAFSSRPPSRRRSFRASPAPALTSVKYELLTGSLLFCAVFLLGDPVTSPRTTVGRCLFGVLAGGLLMAMRQTGSFEQAACFAVLIADAFAPVLDHAAIRLRAKGVRLP